MNLFPKKIAVFSRLNITNYGDPIIADCCEYIIKKTAKEEHVRIKTKQVDLYLDDPNKMEKELAGYNTVVYPGGGLNSVKFNLRIMDIMKVLEKNAKAKVFFNAVGILRVNPKEKNENLLRQMFTHPLVKQVTTRGDFKRLVETIIDHNIPGQYPPCLVFDPAIWADETYQVNKNADSEIVGIGVIRPEIFEENGNDLSVDDIYNMYIGIIEELDRRSIKWKLFTNGMKKDYEVITRILGKLNLDEEEYAVPNPANRVELVSNISEFKGVIAARMHANIIATSLGIPSVGLVWNDKMNLFGEIIGSPDRYISGEKLKDYKYLVDKLEVAIAEGYDKEIIEKTKKKTVETIRNIIRG